MSQSIDLQKLQGLDWLVEARNEIQSLMLELYKCSPTTNTRVKDWNLLLGAVFSLWRAVFLVETADVDRTISDLSGGANAFLKKVIETNAITFADESNERKRFWTSGYYLNNARYRVKQLAEYCTNAKLREHISEALLKEVWNETFAAVQNGVERFKEATRPNAANDLK